MRNRWPCIVIAVLCCLLAPPPIVQAVSFGGPELIFSDPLVVDVSIFVAGGSNTDNFLLQALDANDLLLDSKSISTKGWSQLSVHSAIGIRKVILSQTGDCCWVADNLSFTPISTVSPTLIDFDHDAAGNPLTVPSAFIDTTPLRDLYVPLGVFFIGLNGITDFGGSILNVNGNFGIDPLSGSNFLAFNKFSVPEPSALFLLVTGLVALGVVRRGQDHRGQ